jgi:hypothetical protein
MSTVVAWLFLALPFLVLALGRAALRKHPEARTVAFLLTAICCYGLILLAVSFARIEQRAAVDNFDLDHNGLISGDEDTAAAREAINTASSDTGLTFAPITGVVYALIWSGLVFIGDDWLSYFRGRRKTRLASF